MKKTSFINIKLINLKNIFLLLLVRKNILRKEMSI